MLFTNKVNSDEVPQLQDLQPPANSGQATSIWPLSMAPMPREPERYSMASSSQQFPRHYTPSFPPIQPRHGLLPVSQNCLGADQYATQQIQQPQCFTNARGPYPSISAPRNPSWSLPSNSHPLARNTPFDHQAASARQLPHPAPTRIGIVPTPTTLRTSFSGGSGAPPVGCCDDSTTHPIHHSGTDDETSELDRIYSQTSQSSIASASQRANSTSSPSPNETRETSSFGYLPASQSPSRTMYDDLAYFNHSSAPTTIDPASILLTTTAPALSLYTPRTSPYGYYNPPTTSSHTGPVAGSTSPELNFGAGPRNQGPTARRY